MDIGMDARMNARMKTEPDVKEGFEGIRKDNSRIIFGLLLSFIIIDFIYDCFQ